MVLNAEKRRQLAAVAAQLKAAPGPFAPTPIDQRLKGVVEVTEAAASEDEDTCSGLIFKRKRKADVVVPAPLGSDGRAPSYKERPPSASSPRDIVVYEGRGRVLQGAIVVSPLLICRPSFSGCWSPSRPKRDWGT